MLASAVARSRRSSNCEGTAGVWERGDRCVPATHFGNHGLVPMDVVDVHDVRNERGYKGVPADHIEDIQVSRLNTNRVHR